MRDHLSTLAENLRPGSASSPSRRWPTDFRDGTRPHPDHGDIEAAERLLGIDYTARERQQMVGNLEGQICPGPGACAAPLDNTVPMASRFDPRLPAFAMPAATELRAGRCQPARPGNDEDIAFAPVTQLAGLDQRWRYDQPRADRIYLDRIAALNPNLECFAMVTPDRRSPKRRPPMR